MTTEMSRLGRFRGVALALFWLCVVGSMGVSRADELHTPVFYEGRVGSYVARVMVRPPGVIPGLSEIAVRVLEGDVERVTALPIKWNMGKEGAPPPDVATPVRGEDRLFSTQLWLMEGGAHGIEVELSGKAGSGTVLVPINSVATRVMGVPRWLGGVLLVLGVMLIAMLVSMAHAAVRESVLAPGEVPTRRRRWAAHAVATLVALGTSGLLWGGWTWWEAEAAEYRNNRLYRPRPAEVSATNTDGRRMLRVGLGDNGNRALPPLVPDHGRLMHAFLVREPDMSALAHVHPIRLNRKTFEAELPSALPGGEFSAYVQITHETGFTETLTNRVHVPSPGGGASQGQGLDVEDAWTTTIPTTTEMPSDLGDRLRMSRFGTARVRVREAVSLKFRVEDATGAPVPLEPYLGMLGHMIVRSHDGRVFTHAHPSGTFSMAAQQLFAMREAGLAPRKVNFGANDPTCQLPGVEESTSEWMAQLPKLASGEVSFPYEFVASGKYRCWVQVRAGGRIRTGVFDIEAGGAETPGGH